MGIAEGVSRIDWFEAREGGLNHGAAQQQQQPESVLHRYKNLITNLGGNPNTLAGCY